MKKLYSIERTHRLILETIDRLELDLRGMNVLTELASGNYIVTPIIACLAGAKKTFVVSENSHYGSIEELREYLSEVCELMGIDNTRIQYVQEKKTVARDVNIVTNSGFVRPILDDFICKLPSEAAISLMFESWEYRKEDVDLNSCYLNNIPVMAVNENDSRLNIFRYVGLIALKILLENEIEVYKSRIALLSSGEYKKNIFDVLKSNGAEIDCFDEVDIMKLDNNVYYDGIIVAIQDSAKCLLTRYEASFLKETRFRNAILVHIAGEIDYDWISECQIRKIPTKETKAHYMTLTTDYVGVRPVIELNAGGLKVGQRLVEGMRLYGNVDMACAYALKDNVAQRLLLP